MATTQTVSTPAMTASGRQPLRLTRRGRLTVLIVVALAVLILGSWRAMTADADVEGSGAEGSGAVAVTVQPGDTLWTISMSLAPGADPRVLIAEIRSLNGLTQSGLMPGQVLLVPAS
jgi:LysM repeat protein